MDKHIHKCIICGKEYEYCPKCDTKHEEWKLIYCSKDCQAIDKIRDLFKVGKLSKALAQTKLASYTLPSQFQNWCKETMEEMLKADEKPAEVKIDEVKAEETPIETKIDVETVKPQTKRRNKRR